MNNKKDHKWLFACGLPWFQKWWVYILLFAISIACYRLPYWIDEATRRNAYSLSFDKKDLLQFWGAVLSFIGTVSLGALALWQNMKANNINDRLLKMEESKEQPIIDFTTSRAFVEFTKANNSLSVTIYMKNISSVIAKKCNIQSAVVFNNGICYKMDREKLSNFFNDRTIIPNDEFHFVLECERNVDNNLIQKYDATMQEMVETKYNEPYYKDVMFILDIDFNIYNTYNNSSTEHLSCLFQKGQGCNNTIWNRTINIRQNSRSDISE